MRGSVQSTAHKISLNLFGQGLGCETETHRHPVFVSSESRKLQGLSRREVLILNTSIEESKLSFLGLHVVFEIHGLQK